METFVDVHEDSFHGKLRSAGLEFQVSALPVGDIVKGDLVIERKTFSDFVSSVQSQRLFTQLMQMQDNFNRCFLCISGLFKDYSYQAFQMGKRGWLVENHLGVLASISARYEKIKVVQVDNDTQLAKFIVKLLDKGFDGKIPKLAHTSVMKVRDKMTVDDVKIKMLMSIPKISYMRAKALREHLDIKLVNKEGLPITDNDLAGIGGFGRVLSDKVLEINK